MTTVERFAETLRRHRAQLRPPAKRRVHQIFQDYQSFLTDVGDGTVGPDAEGWRFWGYDEICALDEARRKFGQASLPDDLQAEAFLVFADVDDGRRLFAMRRLRPRVAAPLIFANQGNDLWPFARDFDDFVDQLEHDAER